MLIPQKQHIVVLRRLLSSLEIIQAQPTTLSLAFKVHLHLETTVVRSCQPSMIVYEVKPQLSINMIMLLPSEPACWTIQTSQGTSIHTAMLTIIIGAIYQPCRSCKSPYIPLGLLIDRESGAVKGSWPAFIYNQAIAVATINTLIMLRKWFGWFPNSAWAPDETETTLPKSTNLLTMTLFDNSFKAIRFLVCSWSVYLVGRY